MFLLILIIIFRNKLNVKEAIDYIAEGWNNVTQKTIWNCWIKTGILPLYDDEDVDESDLDDDEVGNLFYHLPESDDIIEYFQILDHDVPTEENLTDEAIINLVQFEKEKGNVNDDDDDDDDKILPISVKNAVGRLETFINYFE